MPFCPSCGSANHHSSKRCNQCGHWFIGVASMGDNAQMSIRKGMEPWKAILIGLLPLSLCGLCGLFGMLSDNSNRNRAGLYDNGNRIVTKTENNNAVAKPGSTQNKNEDKGTETVLNPKADPKAANNNNALSDNTANSNGSTKSTQEKTIIGNRSSKIYHWQGCPNYNDIAEQNRVYFATADEAEASGYRAARNCGGSSASKTPVYSPPPPPPPARNQTNSASLPPAGATAKCRDGTYSYSANRRGTCSHHGGVAVWY